MGRFDDGEWEMGPLATYSVAIGDMYRLGLGKVLKISSIS